MVKPENVVEFLVNYLEEVWDKHDFERARSAYWHLEVHTAGADQYPVGYEGMMLQIKPFLAVFPDARIELESVLVQGDTLAARLWLTGTDRGEIFGRAPTGKKVRFREYVFVELKDDKLWRYHPLVDWKDMEEQLETNP